MDRKILVIGGTGLIGSALMKAFCKVGEVDVLGTSYSQNYQSYRYIELENLTSIYNVLHDFHPDDVYITAAISNVDRCQTDPNTNKINYEAVRYISQLSTIMKFRIIFFSTSYVFDGKKDKAYTTYDVPLPINEYGIQKLKSEILLLNSSSSNIIIRTVGVFGVEAARKSFGYQVVDKINLGMDIYVPDDQFMNPILSDNLAASTIRAAELNYSGILHIAGSDCLSKYEFAVDIARTFGLSTSHIIPVASIITKQTAIRPVNGCLKNTISTQYNYLQSLDKFYDDF